MTAITVTGALYGDEGKGKVADAIGDKADKFVKFQGGSNAGNTCVVDGKEYILHLLPAGAVRGKRCLIASGVVLNPERLVEEIEMFNHDVNLGIDPRTMLVLPYHISLDIARENLRKKNEGEAIGTTAQGIGPAYESNKGRVDPRFFDLVTGGKSLEEILRNNYRLNKKILEEVYDFGVFVPKGGKYGAPLIEIEENEFVGRYVELGSRLGRYLTDVSIEVINALNDNKNILFQGSQGVNLDITFGNYPKVTSSHPTPAGVFTSVGIPPMFFDESIGVVKAYLSKVGSGPVPTCLDGGKWPVDEEYSSNIAKKIRKDGKEYGATTGRPRRVAWLDLVQLKDMCKLCGFTQLALTKLDVLADKGDLKLATAYDTGISYNSWDIDGLNNSRPFYITCNGFSSKDLVNAKTFDDLPIGAKNYITNIEFYTQVPITFISIGADRHKTIFRNFSGF